MAKRGIVRGVFRSLLGALAAGRAAAEKRIALEQQKQAAEVITGEASGVTLALPAPKPRQPRRTFHVRQGWSVPQPGAIPAPTYVPAAMAFGIVMVTLGIVTRWFFVLLGAILILTAAWHWIEELLGEKGAGVDLE